MASIGVNIYSFHIHDVEGKQLDLKEVVNNKSILDIFQEFIETKIGFYEDNASKEQIYQFVDYDIVQQKDESGSSYLQYLYGRIKTGNYGIETEIVDRTTGDVAHRQTTNEAGVKPFDFVIALPEDTCDETIIVLQTVSRYGIKSLLRAELNRFIKDTYGLGYVYFGTIYPREFVQKYINDGVLKKLRLIRNGLPEDIASGYGVNYGHRKAKKETIITSPLGFAKELLERITECVKGNILYTDLVELDVDEQYDDVKLDFNLDGKKKSISLKNLEKVVISEDITSVVEAPGGNPLKESIQNIMVKYATEYLIEKGFLARLTYICNEVISSIPKEDDNHEGINK